jgi:hypothetical protein
LDELGRPKQHSAHSANIDHTNQQCGKRATESPRGTNLRNIKITLISIVVNRLGGVLPKESCSRVVAAKYESGFQQLGSRRILISGSIRLRYMLQDIIATRKACVWVLKNSIIHD